MSVNLNSFRLNQHGLARLFGELEAKVMDAVWKLEQPTVHDVVRELGEDAHYKTVMTVMNRLVGKGFLARRKVSRAFVYAPTTTREALLDKLSRQMFDGLLTDFGPTVIAQFVEAVEAADHAHLLALVELVEQKLAETRGDE